MLEYILNKFDSFCVTGFPEAVKGIDSTGTFMTVMRQKAEDRVMGIRRGSPGWQTQQVAQQLLAHPEIESAVANIAAIIVGKICDSFTGVNQEKFSNQGVLKMLERLNLDRIDPDVLLQWMECLTGLGVTSTRRVANNLLQHMWEGLNTLVSRQLTSKAPQPLSQATVTPLSVEEKQVLFYAAGYIPRKLRRKVVLEPLINRATMR